MNWSVWLLSKSKNSGEAFGRTTTEGRCLYAKYQGKGYTHSQTIDFERKDGTPDTRLHTQWTQKGRLFLYELLKANEMLPMIEKPNKSA